jgi:hypothetical protein
MKNLSVPFLAVTAVSFVVLSKASSVASAVVELTDATFEHQTQASTGMTTGSWFVLFSNNESRDLSDGTIKPILSALADPSSPPGDEGDSEPDTTLADRGIVFATVDCDNTGKKTCQRFNIIPPALLFFHQKSMYAYPSSSSSSGSDGEEEGEFLRLDISEELVKKFVLDDYARTTERLGIPPPPSAMEEMLAPIVELYELGMRPENRLTFVAIGGMAIMLLVTIVVLAVTLLSPKAVTTGTNSKSKKKKS